jgi:hypothetical protein
VKPIWRDDNGIIASRSLYAPENAEFANSPQVIWAERFVYDKEQEHLEIPIDMLRTNPELMDWPERNAGVKSSFLTDFNVI